MELSPWRMQPGYFHVIADPVSTCVREIFEFLPRPAPRLVTKLKIPPRPSSSPGYQFWMVEYLIIQNWYPGDEEGRGGIFNFVTKGGAWRGRESQISWMQVETGAAITWQYLGCVLQGDSSMCELYSAGVVDLSPPWSTRS